MMLDLVCHIFVIFSLAFKWFKNSTEPKVRAHGLN